MGAPVHTEGVEALLFTLVADVRSVVHVEAGVEVQSKLLTMPLQSCVLAPVVVCSAAGDVKRHW